MAKPISSRVLKVSFTISGLPQIIKRLFSGVKSMLKARAKSPFASNSGRRAPCSWPPGLRVVTGTKLSLWKYSSISGWCFKSAIVWLKISSSACDTECASASRSKRCQMSGCCKMDKNGAMPEPVQSMIKSRPSTKRSGSRKPVAFLSSSIVSPAFISANLALIGPASISTAKYSSVSAYSADTTE